MNPQTGLRPRVLVVDDATDVSSMIAGYLNSQGFPVDVANSGLAALAMLPTSWPKIVLSDIRMPEMNGIDLLISLKRQCPMAIVVMMTGYRDIPTMVQCLGHGAHDFILKPIEPLSLLLDVVSDAENKLCRWSQALRTSIVAEPVSDY